MVFVNSPWDNCNLRWIVHSGLPVSICWVCGVCYSGTRVQKCRARAPRLSSDLQYIPVCLFSPITHSKAVLCTDLKGMRWRTRQKLNVKAEEEQMSELKDGMRRITECTEQSATSQNQSLHVPPSCPLYMECSFIMILQIPTAILIFVFNILFVLELHFPNPYPWGPHIYFKRWGALLL